MQIKNEEEMLALGELFAQQILQLTEFSSQNAQKSPGALSSSENKKVGDLPSPLIIELVGDVGVGKTTFTRGLARGFGVFEPVTSPSFLISKRYQFANNRELIHYDFYRLNDMNIMCSELSEALASSGNIIVVEWADDVAELLPREHLTIKFQLQNDNIRRITLTDREPPRLAYLANTVENLWKTCGKLPQDCAKNHLICGKSSESATQNIQKVIPNTPARSQNAQKTTKSIAMYLDTSNNVCTLRLNDRTYTWDAGHEMAHGILRFIADKLAEQQGTWQDLSQITYFSGPGSFTGLRIGAAVVNTLTDQLDIPLYDHHGTHHQVIMPDYGRPANITPPRK